MVLLQEDQLLLQGLNLTLKVHAVQVGVVDDLPQANNICLHRLANGEFRLKPVEWTEDGEPDHVETPRVVGCITVSMGW